MADHDVVVDVTTLAFLDAYLLESGVGVQCCTHARCTPLFAQSPLVEYAEVSRRWQQYRLVPMASQYGVAGLSHPPLYHNRTILYYDHK